MGEKHLFWHSVLFLSIRKVLAQCNKEGSTVGAVILAGAALSAICCFLVVDDRCYLNVVQNLASKAMTMKSTNPTAVRKPISGVQIYFGLRF